MLQVTIGKAMVLLKFNEPLIMQEYSLPIPEKGEVLVKITAAGVCGSDVHMWRGNDPRTPLPLIMGHEGVGKVVAVGDKRSDLFGSVVHEGDEILWHRGVNCCNCYYCLVIKEPSLCENRKVYGINRGCSDYPHFRGCFAEYILLDENTILFPVPQEIDSAVIVSTSCSGSTMAHAFDLVSPQLGDTVLVQGPGPLGLYAVAFARAYGAGEIIVIGGTNSRLELSRAFGATQVINRHQMKQEERYEKVMDLTGGKGVDYAVEAVGATNAVEEGVTLVRAGGVYLSTGFGEPRGTVMLDCFRDIVHKNLRLQGVWVSDVRHTYMAYRLLLKNPDLFGRMITHKYLLEDVNSALKSMESKEAIKAVITMER